MQRNTRAWSTGLLAALATAALVWATPQPTLPTQAAPADVPSAAPSEATPPAAPPVGARVGALAPDFALKTLDGHTVRLSDLRGRPVYLNFWATWCPPCRMEMPFIQQAFAAGGKVQIYAVDWTTQESSLAKVRAYLKDGGYTFPVLLDDDDQAADLFHLRGIPYSVFIDAKGVIRGMHLGAMTDAQTLLDALKKLEES